MEPLGLSPYHKVVKEIAQVHGLDPVLVEAVITQESSGRADAFRYEPGYYERYVKGRAPWVHQEPRRIASSYGLMQVMYPTAVDHGFEGEPEGLFDIRTNLTVGCRVLRRLLDRFEGEEALALAAYNGGVGNVSGGQPRRYAQEVLARRTRYARAYSVESPGGTAVPTD